KIEVYYDKYMDIEWAYSKGKFYFLQTRPITTLADEELPILDVSKMDRLQREVYDWVAERFPEPIHPIDGIVVKLLFMAQFEAMQEFGFTIDLMDWGKIEKGIFPEFFEPPAIHAGIRRIWPYLRLGRTLKSDPAAEWGREQVYLLDMLKKLRGRDISGLPYEIITDYITEAFNHLHFFTVMRYRYFAQNRVPTILLSKFLSLLFKEQGTEVYDTLHAGVENVTLELNRALYQLAGEVRENSGVEEVFSECVPERILEQLDKVPGGAEFVGKFNDFLGAYGDRETTMGLGGIASPTWQDSPEIVLGIIKAVLSEDPGTEEAREKRRAEKTRQAEERLYARLSRGIWAIIPIKSFVKKIIAHSRSFTAFRENSHYDVTRGLHVFRILFIEVGRRFVRKGILKDEADIFYLDYFEVKEIISTIYFGLEDLNVKALNKKIETRKEERLRRINRWRLRNIKVDETSSIKGVPASLGIVSGTVKIIKDPSEFQKLKKGDILVAPYTNPAWTPLFSTAAGLVAETGGVASHAAIIAREYGIPAVMGVIRATEIFTDGEIITINGSTGSIIRGQIQEG
ncbi:MAG TPA: PEP-utilizing enzyme, partial [Desulfobacteria bacterium]|nr:PEP-utilizing enzyme [Desulfobacteria bacterium]